MGKICAVYATQGEVRLGECVVNLNECTYVICHNSKLLCK